MKYRPVGSLQETIVAGAEFDADSAFTFMSLIEQKKELQRRLQEAREDAFFDPDRMSMNVTIDDIDTEDIMVPQMEEQEVEGITSGDWRTIIEDCYCYRESRDPEEPLTRLNSVSQNVELPTIDTTSIRFDTDNVRLDTIDGQEALEIHLDQDNSIVLFINTDNVEFYQGMYSPPVTREIDTLYGNTGSFDMVTVRNNTEIGKELMESVKPETVQREMSTTEVIFGNELSKSHYIPESQVSTPSESEEVFSDIQNLRLCDPLPNRETEKILLETLERGYLLSEESLKLFDYITGQRENIEISYSYTAKPEYISELARLTESNVASIPQRETLVLSTDLIPDWIEQLDDDFPHKNELSETEAHKLQEFLDLPEFVNIDSDWIDNLRSREKLLEMFESQEIGQDKIVSYYLVPWEYTDPSEESIEQAIRYGQNLRERLRSVDREYDLDLYISTVTWEQRKVYRKSNFEI